MILMYLLIHLRHNRLALKCITIPFTSNGISIFAIVTFTHNLLRNRVTGQLQRRVFSCLGKEKVF